MIYTLYIKDDKDNISETISLDVINNFGESYSSNVPQNAVENGFNISDSINLNNPSFNISGVITDSKFRVAGQLVIFNGFNFIKTMGDNREVQTQLPDDQLANSVRDRLIKLWEDSQVFGILESTDIRELQGSRIRDIFPCVLTNVSFAKNDTANAFYPSLTVERFRYSTVKVTEVTNAVPELIPLRNSTQAGDSQVAESSVTVNDKGETVDDSVSKDLQKQLDETNKTVTDAKNKAKNDAVNKDPTVAENWSGAAQQGADELTELQSRAANLKKQVAAELIRVYGKAEGTRMAKARGLI